MGLGGQYGLKAILILWLYTRPCPELTFGPVHPVHCVHGGRSEPVM